MQFIELKNLFNLRNTPISLFPFTNPPLNKLKIKCLEIKKGIIIKSVNLRLRSQGEINHDLNNFKIRINMLIWSKFLKPGIRAKKPKSVLQGN